MPYFENDGLSLYYDERGSGRLLLILPGNTATSACHEGELDFFGKTFRAVSFDFRDTGKSTRLPSRTGEWWDQCADDAAALVAHLGEQQCVVMGTSGGAGIALLFAIKYPTLVSGIIADSCAEIYAPENLRKEVSERALKTREQVEFWEYANGADWEAVVDADSSMLLDFADRGGDLFEGRLNMIRCPVLFTGTLVDTFIPDMGAQCCRMAKQIPHAATFLCNDGDHPFMWTCPDLFRAVSAEFLKRRM